MTLHRAIASELRKRPGQGALQADLAYHWREAGERHKSCTAYIAAGDYARRVYAFRDALDYYDSALRQECDDLELAIALKRAETQLAQGLLGEAQPAFELLLKRIESVHDVDPVLRATLLLRLSACDWAALRRQSSVVWATRARDAANASDACAAQRAEALVMLARAAVLRGDAGEALEYLETVGAVGDTDLALSIAGYRGLALGMFGRQSEAIAAVTAPSENMLQDAMDVGALAAFRQNQGVTLGWFGRFGESRSSFEAVVAIGRRAHNALIEAIGHIGLGYVAYYTDDLRLARECYDTAAALAGDTPHVAALYSAALGLRIAAATGDRELAERLMSERLFTMCEEPDDVLFVNTLTGALIDCAAVFGDGARAQLLLKSYLSSLQVGSGLMYVIPSLLQLGDESDIARALVLARAWTASGDNELGEAFTSMLLATQCVARGAVADANAASVAAVPTLERLGLRRFVGVVESPFKATSTLQHD